MTELYLICTSDRCHCKIGIAQNSQNRRSELQVGNHEPIRLIATYDLGSVDGKDIEKAVHKALAVWRQRGEWFNIAPQRAHDQILETISAVGVTAASHVREGLDDTAVEVFTMEQVSQKLHISRRSLQDLIKKYPYYRTIGRRKLFSVGDFNALVRSLPTGRQVQAVNAAWRKESAGMSESRLWAKARTLLNNSDETRH